MRVKDLISMLEEFDGDTEVLVATQPNWPLQFELEGVVSLAECDDEVEELEDDEDDTFEDIVYLVASSHPYGKSPYAPKVVFER